MDNQPLVQGEIDRFMQLFAAFCIQRNDCLSQACKGVAAIAISCIVYSMDIELFFEKLRQNPRPVVVDLWAPWCGPCRAVRPTLEKLAQEYAGRVDLWEINADENGELLRKLKIYGIPTLIAYHDHEEKVRYVGTRSQKDLEALFEALSRGSVPVSNGLPGWERLARLLAGSVVLGTGWTSHYNWFLLAAGGVLLFSAVYDRCPIWKAITAQFRKIAAK